MPKSWSHSKLVRRRTERVASGQRGDGTARIEDGVLDIVHGGNGLLRIALLGVADEAEAAAAASVTILDHDLCMVDLGSEELYRRTGRVEMR